MKTTKPGRYGYTQIISQKGILPSLPKFELYLYIFLWISSVSRACYNAYYYAQELRPLLSPQEFGPGWTLLNREKDVADYEWTVWSSRFIALIPWILIHIVISQFLWRKASQFLTSFYFVFSLMCLLYQLGVLPTTFLLFQPILMFLAHFSRRKIVCWSTGLIFLLTVNIGPFIKIREFIVPSYTEEEYIMSVITAWTNTRCLSYCLHRCDKPREKCSVMKDFINFLGFCFYLPLLFTGPLMMFDDFLKQMQVAKPKWTSTYILYIVANFFRYIFWFIFNEVFVHFVYVEALSMHPNLVAQLSVCSLCGLAFIVSQFFMCKYTVLYGLPGIIARLEDYDPPPKPKCISRIHLYSDMWRYFDRGLYTFLKRYIYVPYIGTNPSTWRKLTGSALCFAFIFTWHGIAYFILIWAVLNYIGIVLEVIASVGSSSKFVTTIEEEWLNPRWSRRIRGAVITPLLCMSAVSNFYFLLGYEVGNIIVEQLILKASYLSFFSVLFSMYCMCQLSIEIKNWEIRKALKNKDT